MLDVICYVGFTVSLTIAVYFSYYDPCTVRRKMNESRDRFREWLIK